MLLFWKNPKDGCYLTASRIYRKIDNDDFIREKCSSSFSQTKTNRKQQNKQKTQQVPGLRRMKGSPSVIVKQNNESGTKPPLFDSEPRATNLPFAISALDSFIIGHKTTLNGSFRK